MWYVKSIGIAIAGVVGGSFISTMWYVKFLLH
ncbi:hypothetical protein BN1095_330425 [Clostridioides difficile]|uniref:Uncharacterized protein n=1 Tax=Clostridioides difficile TaxID=1496 RepID=A0A069ASC9_CLODI|nr:hypothetical protein BN1096_630140 [Clostridioides difficile]CDS88145.1 hypothetical protein BN1097_640004 [Clostridioides difficile]CDT17539.1 hypothetical protein BN1095_330425 [Clostridioides difficile]